VFFQRKPGKKLPRVCVYYFQDDKQIAIPRKITKHLDGKPDDMVEEWMVWYSAVGEVISPESHNEASSASWSTSAGAC